MRWQWRVLMNHEGFKSNIDARLDICEMVYILIFTEENLNSGVVLRTVNEYLKVRDKSKTHLLAYHLHADVAKLRGLAKTVWAH